LPGNNITATVAHHVAVCKIYFPLSCGFQKHPGLGFAAFATFILAVRTYLDIVHLQALFEPLVHGFDCNAVYEPIADVGLVGNNDDQEIGALERLHGILHPWQQSKILESARSIRLAVANFAAVNYTIPVKEDCAAQRNC
jgi:hypothetical protein